MKWKRYNAPSDFEIGDMVVLSWESRSLTIGDFGIVTGSYTLMVEVQYISYEKSSATSPSLLLKVADDPGLLKNLLNLYKQT